MEDRKEVNARLRRAVELMTAWNESNDGDTSFVSNLVAVDLTEAMAHDALVDEAIILISGLMSLAGRLLVELERSSGKSISNILQRAGQQAAD